VGGDAVGSAEKDGVITVNGKRSVTSQNCSLVLKIGISIEFILDAPDGMIP
jgi:hypothetical protein